MVVGNLRAAWLYHTRLIHAVIFIHFIENARILLRRLPVGANIDRVAVNVHQYGFGDFCDAPEHTRARGVVREKTNFQTLIGKSRFDAL